MRRRRWRTVVLWVGCTLCVLIVAAFVVSVWWVFLVRMPRGPNVALGAGSVALVGMESPIPLVSITPHAVKLSEWNLWSSRRGRHTYFVVFPLYAVFLAVAVPTLLVWRFVPKFPRGHCRRYGYNLTGLTEARCPECGTGFEPGGDAR